MRNIKLNSCNIRETLEDNCKLFRENTNEDNHYPEVSIKLNPGRCRTKVIRNWEYTKHSHENSFPINLTQPRNKILIVECTFIKIE